MIPKKAKAKTTTKPKQQQLNEREELAATLQQMTDKRFPSSDKMTTTKRLDRLERCTAQTLAVMDKLLEFWSAKTCPFTADNPDKPTKPESTQITTTTLIEPTKPDISNHHHSHSPYI